MKVFGATAVLIPAIVLIGVAMQGMPQESTERIAGTITRSDTGAFLPNVRVELIRDDYARLPTGQEKVCKPEPDWEVSDKRRFANTDSNGKFTFTNITPGSYYLTAEREGYLRASYGQRGIYALGIPLKIGQLPDVVSRPTQTDEPLDIVNAFSNVRGRGETAIQGTIPGMPPGLEGNIAQTGQRGGLTREAQRIPNGAGAPSVIGEGNSTGTSRILLQDLSIPLTPAPTIAGLVLDERGAPRAAASVQAYQFRYTPMNGRSLRSMRTTLTGENGDYRLFWLNPGRYIVAAAYTQYSLQPWLSTLSLTPNLPAADAGLPTVFFPTSPNAGDAIPLRLNPRDEPRADLRLRSRARFPMKIQLTGDRLPPNPTLIFIPYGGDLCAALDYGISGTRDGAFELKDVPEGLYVTMAISGRDTISELVTLRVDRDSPRELRLPVAPPTVINGNVFFDQLPPGTDLGPLRVSLVRAGREVSQTATTVVDPSNGRFSIPGVGPGSYFPVVDLPPGAFVHNVVASKSQIDKPDDCDASTRTPIYSYQDLHGHFDPQKPLQIPTVIPNAASCVSIRISFGFPLLGYVRDRLDKPVSGALVVAVPRSVWGKGDDGGVTPPDRYLTATTDEVGFFRLNGASPQMTADSVTQEEYHLFAFEDLDPNMIYDPGFSDRFRTRASFVMREWGFANGRWVVTKIFNLPAAMYDTCGAQDVPGIVVARCYLTVIPAEDTAEIQ